MLGGERGASYDTELIISCSRFPNPQPPFSIFQVICLSKKRVLTSSQLILHIRVPPNNYTQRLNSLSLQQAGHHARFSPGSRTTWALWEFPFGGRVVRKRGLSGTKKFAKGQQLVSSQVKIWTRSGPPTFLYDVFNHRYHLRGRGQRE